MGRLLSPPEICGLEVNCEQYQHQDRWFPQIERHEKEKDPAGRFAEKFLQAGLVTNQKSNQQPGSGDGVEDAPHCRCENAKINHPSERRGQRGRQEGRERLHPFSHGAPPGAGDPAGPPEYEPR